MTAKIQLFFNTCKFFCQKKQQRIAPHQKNTHQTYPASRKICALRVSPHPPQRRCLRHDGQYAVVSGIKFSRLVGINKYQSYTRSYPRSSMLRGWLVKVWQGMLKEVQSLCRAIFNSFAAVSRVYHPSPLPPLLLSGEAGELKLLSTLKLKGGAAPDLFPTCRDKQG